MDDEVLAKSKALLQVKFDTDWQDVVRQCSRKRAQAIEQENQRFVDLLSAAGINEGTFSVLYYAYADLSEECQIVDRIGRN